MQAQTSFVGRALLALFLLVGFYALALGLAGLLLYLPYAELVYGHRLHIKIAFLCLAGAFAILKGSVFVGSAPFEPPGPEITERDQPRLFALIREVAERMHTSMPKRVFLVPDVNAFVAEVGGFMGFGAERVMGIGVGLLAVDSVSELKATIAHEFGHYAGGDTRLGAIVYRTRVAIFGVLGHLGEGVLSKPFEWYAKLFLRVSHGVSRAQELSADRASVALAGKEAHIRGLEREARGAVLFSRFMDTEVVPLFRAGFRPHDLYDGFHDYTREQERRGVLPELDGMLKQQTTDPYDTHPALPERIAFAAALPANAVPVDDTPALTLLEAPERMQTHLVDQLAARIAGHGTALQPVAWAEVSARVHAPKLAIDAAESVALVSSALASAPNAEAALRALFTRLAGGSLRELAGALEPRFGEVPAEIADEVAPHIVQRHLGLVLGAHLVARGGSWVSPLGAPYAVVSPDGLVEPFGLAADAVSEPGGREKLATVASL